MANANPEEAEIDDNAWTSKFYPRGEATGFDRLIFFSDAVFAIALTLMAVEIGIPHIDDPTSQHDLLDAIGEKAPEFFAYAVGFIWVAIYWRANHRFVRTLRGMSSHYVFVALIYLAFVAFLPFAAGLLGQYGGENPVAVAFFAIFAALVSFWEVVLLLVADHDNLFVKPLSRPFLRQQIAGSCVPLGAFLLSIPLAFWIGPIVAMLFWLAFSIVGGFAVAKLMPATPPE